MIHPADQPEHQHQHQYQRQHQHQHQNEREVTDPVPLENILMAR